jgi:hypothetical protein
MSTSHRRIGGRFIVDWATGYAAIGWRVFPAYRPNRPQYWTNDECFCDKPVCDAAGEHSVEAEGVKRATTDVSRIRSWWKKWPWASVGIALGRQSNIVALELQLPSLVVTQHHGVADLHELTKSWRDNTPAMGHRWLRTYIFEHPETDSGNLRFCFDGLAAMKVEDDFIIVPPSWAPVRYPRRDQWNELRWDMDRSPDRCEPPPLPRSLLLLARLANEAQCRSRVVTGPA